MISFYTVLLPLLLLFNFKYWNIGNVITIRLFTKVDIGGFLSFLARSLPPWVGRSFAVTTTFLLPVLWLKLFCVDNFLTLMFWFLESRSYPPFQQSAILSISSHLPLLYPHASLSSVSWIHSEEACRWMAALISLYRYFWISVAVERVVNDFVNVTAACAQHHNRLFYISIMILFWSPLYQCKMEYNFCHFVSLDSKVNYKLSPRVISKSFSAVGP